MIQIKYIKQNENYAEIVALYDFLLFQTLPFAPSDFLPIDEIGPYYYKDGNRNSCKIYPKDYMKKWKLHQSSEKYLQDYEEVLSKCKGFSEAFPNKRLKNAKELIRFVSKDLYQWLYITGTDKKSTGLRKLLLELIPNQKTIESKEMSFALNPDLLWEAEKQERCDDEFQQGLWDLLYIEIFHYDKFSRNKLFPKLVQLLDVPVCPYCNRSFTTTVQKKDGTYHRQNQVDHYVPKSLYPWFALSINNMIPACGNCNHKKSDDGDFVLYPYEEDFGEHYQFRTVPVSGVGYLIGQPESLDEFQVVIEESSEDGKDDYRKRAKHSIEKLGLDVLYRESHNAYVAGIYRKRYIFGEAYIKLLMESFQGMFQSESEVRRLLYLKEFEKGKWDRDILSKLTHDIDEEIAKLSKWEM